MIGLILIFFTSLLVAFSGAMMPGPLLSVTITESSVRGASAGPLLIVGHSILEMLLLIGLLLGLGPLLENEVFFIVIAFMGGSIMLWMAWGMLKSLPTLVVQASQNHVKKGSLLITGILMSLANPYWIIWWATIGIGYIVQSQQFGYLGILFFYLGHITGDFIWYSAISFTISQGKRLFTDKVYRILVGVCGSFLVGFAIYLLVTGINKLV